jgi:1-propanol dehydrogenase
MRGWPKRLLPGKANDVTAINALIQRIERLKQQCAAFTGVALKEEDPTFPRVPAMVQAALADVTTHQPASGLR